MRRWTLAFGEEDRENFALLQSGEKTVETRAARPEYTDISVGDTIVFTCGDESLEKRVVQRYHWQSVEDMAREIDFKLVLPHAISLNDVIRRYDAYPGYRERIANGGLLGFALA